jgi:hypothetical protein
MSHDPNPATPDKTAPDTMFDTLNPLSSSNDSESPAIAPNTQLEPDPDLMPPEGVLDAPVSRSAVAVAREQNPSLRERSRADDLVDVLNDIQRWIDNQEYTDRRGNAFFEQLVEDFNDQSTLRRPVLVDEGPEWAELMFIVLREGWVAIQEELGLLDEEVKAARDAHQLYASERGLAQYAETVCVMSVRLRPPRALSIMQASDPTPDVTDLYPGDDPEGVPEPAESAQAPASAPEAEPDPSATSSDPNPALNDEGGGAGEEGEGEPPEIPAEDAGEQTDGEQPEASNEAEDDGFAELFSEAEGKGQTVENQDEDEDTPLEDAIKGESESNQE